MNFKLQFIDSISQIDALNYGEIVDTENPFLQWEFFKTLEDSAVIGKHSGWLTQHLIVKDQQQLIAFVPLFIKHHSYGEYVFDFEWAKAYLTYGLNYYPKLVTAIPFTPVTGKKIFCHPDYDKEEIYRCVLDEISKHCVTNHYSSWHLLFPQKTESMAFASQQMFQKKGVQFHWFNRDYKNFDNFLHQLKIKRRKDIKRERKKVLTQGITMAVLEGSEITPKIWQIFYQFYQHTYLKRSGFGGYLTADFFQLLGQRLKPHIVMIVARFNQQIVAAALYLKDSQTLYGRYWGCLQEFQFLHFECCYYQGVDYCIKNKLQKFDAGAQGEHKLQRGFEPIFTFSNHWISDESFSEAIHHHLELENDATQNYFTAASKKTPFKQT